MATLPGTATPGAFARAVFDALTSGDRSRQGRSAADRLAVGAASAPAGSRGLVRREWELDAAPSLLAVRDVTGGLATPAGADLLADLVANLPPDRMLVVTSRTPLPPALRQIVDDARGTSLGIADLAIPEEAMGDLAVAAGLDRALGNAVYGITGGWPLVSRLLLDLIRRGDAGDELLADAEALSERALFTFSAHRTIARLSTIGREALIVTALLRDATHTQLVRVLGDLCDDVVFASLASLPFVMDSDDRLTVHPEVVALLEQRFAHNVKPLYERTLNALAGDGAYAEAADVALRVGDVTRAAAIIDAAPSYVSSPVPLADYERVIEHLDRDIITRFPNVWIATMPYRSFAVDRATFVREAETVYYCLPPTAGANQRARALMLLASALTNTGRRLDAERLISDALRTFAQEDPDARASLLSFSAWMHGNDGRFARARELAAEASRLSRHEFDDNQALHYIEVHEAAYRGHNERVNVIIDELLRRDDAPLHRAFTAGNGALFAWVSGDDDSVLKYVATVEDTLTPGLERGFRPVIDAARARSIGIDDEAYLWPVMYSVAQLFRLGNAATPDEAVDAARRAAVAADERGDPYLQILAHAARFVLGDDAARAEMKLRDVVAGVESVEMRDAVHALVRHEPAGILEQFVSRRVRREQPGEVREHLVLELLAGRVVRGTRGVKLSDKEFELVALLGAAAAPLSRERIGEALWDHLDPEEWPNNLKVTLSRLRTKLEMRDAVTLVNGRYRLSPLIEVDLGRSEALLRSAIAQPPDGAKRAALREIVTAFQAGTAARYQRFAWAQGLQAKIEDLVCGSAKILAQHALEHREWDDALRLASVAASVDPFDEAASEMAILVHIARGDADAARREFRRYAASLARELGASPSERLARLVRETPARDVTESRAPRGP